MLHAVMATGIISLRIELISMHIRRQSIKRVRLSQNIAINIKVGFYILVIVVVSVASKPHFYG